MAGKDSKKKGTKAEAPADAGGGDVKLMTAKKAAKKLLKKLGRKATDAEVSAFVAKINKKRSKKRKEDGDEKATKGAGPPKKKAKKDKKKGQPSADSAQAAQAIQAVQAAKVSSGGGGGGEVQFNFYTESGDVKCMPKSVVKHFRTENGVTITDSGQTENYNPILEFKHAGMPADIVKAACSTFDKPSPIQAQCWPIVLSGTDCIGIAETGSGKTLAFGLPGIVHVRARGRAKAKTPFMLVIAPTRELAVQTFVFCEKTGKLCEPEVKAVCVYGGVSKHTQVGPLSKGVHIVVATPGRLIDLMEQGAINLAEVSFLVLDEADRMLDMGFEREIKMVMSKSRPDRQTLMFSATWPMEVQDIGRSYMRTPVRVDIGEKDRLTANHKVKQIVEVMENHQKDARLVQLLEKYHKGQKERMLVFCLYKKETQRVETMLQRKGYAAQCINGDLNQDKRTQVLEDFKAGKLKCMVATDVAARGLDVKELGFVINYTFPLTIEDYVHRIGRTGRAGASGLAHTFFTKEDKAHAGALGNILREAGVEVPPALMNFGQGTKRKKHAQYGELTATQEALKGVKATRGTFD